MAGELITESEEDGYEARTDAERLASWLSAYEAGGEDRHRIVALELEARLRRIGASWPARPRPRRARAPGNVGQFVRMTEYLARHYTHPIVVDDVAEALSLHPKYCMALFKNNR